MEQTCRLCASPRQPEATRCECGYVYPPPPKPGFYHDGELPPDHPHPVVVVIPRGPFTLVLSLMMLAMTATNGAGACVVLIAFMCAGLAGQLLGVGAWGYCLPFGISAIIVDAVGRRLLGCSPIDVKRGSQFMLLPAWVVGVFGCVVGGVAFAVTHS